MQKFFGAYEKDLIVGRLGDGEVPVLRVMELLAAHREDKVLFEGQAIDPIYGAFVIQFSAHEWLRISKERPVFEALIPSWLESLLEERS